MHTHIHAPTYPHTHNTPHTQNTHVHTVHAYSPAKETYRSFLTLCNTNLSTDVPSPLHSHWLPHLRLSIAVCCRCCSQRCPWPSTCVKCGHTHTVLCLQLLLPTPDEILKPLVHGRGLPGPSISVCLLSHLVTQCHKTRAFVAQWYISEL